MAGLALLMAVGCTPVDQQLLSDDAAAREKGLKAVERMSAPARKALLPVLMAQLDPEHPVEHPATFDQIAPAMLATAQATLRTQELRQRALLGLRAIGVQSVPALNELLLDSKQRAWVRKDVAMTLADMGPLAVGASPGLHRAFDDMKANPDSAAANLKACAAAALIVLGEREDAFFDELTRCQRYCDEDVRPYAARVLSTR